MNNPDYFSIEQRDKLAEVVLDFIEQGLGKNKEEAESLAFSSIYKQLDKPTPQLCQYIWQEEVRKDYYARYERAIAIGEVNRKERAERKEKEDNDTFVSAILSRLLKGDNISKAIENVAGILNMNPSTANTKWYKLRKDEAVNKQYEDTMEFLKNNNESCFSEQLSSNCKLITEDQLNLAELEKKMNSFFKLYSKLMKKNQELTEKNKELAQENKMIKEKLSNAINFLQAP